MTTLSRLVARALPWRRNPESSADQPEGGVNQSAPLRPEDLRRTINLSEFRSGLRHFVGSAIVTLTAGAATAGLLLLVLQAPSPRDVSFFGGFATFTAFTSFWFLAYCRAAGDELFRRYKDLHLRADEANRENERLFRQNLRILTNLARREEGEAGDGAGGSATSPASNLRFIPHRGRVQ